MRLIANIHVNGRTGLSTAIDALLGSNVIDHAEIEVTDNTPMLDWIRERARILQLRVVEMNGRFVGSSSILRAATLQRVNVRKVRSPVVIH